MTQLLLKDSNLETISEKCKLLLSPKIQSSVLKLIDKCFSEKYSIFTKAKNTYLCITESGLFDAVNHIKYVLQKGNAEGKDRSDLLKHVIKIEEECYQFEKPHPICARKRSQHIVECSGKFEMIKLSFLFIILFIPFLYSGLLSDIVLFLSNKENVPWLSGECFKIIIAASYNNIEVQQR